MQYLVNKTKGSLYLALGNKVGNIKLTPYEALPVDVEKNWDAQAFNKIRMLPTKVGLFERIPKEIAEKRKLYLELVNQDKEEQNEKTIKSLNIDIENLEKEIKKLEKEVETDTKKSIKLEEDLGLNRAKLVNEASNDKEALEIINKKETEFLDLSNNISIKKNKVIQMKQQLSNLQKQRAGLE